MNMVWSSVIATYFCLIVVMHIEAEVQDQAYGNIILELLDGSPLADTLVLRYPDGAVLLNSIAYDSLKNRVGAVDCRWTVSGTLHSPTTGSAPYTSRIFYDVSSITDDESGYLYVEDSVRNFRDSVYIACIGPLGKAISATVHDLNGNGYLDHIKMTFDRPVSLNQNFTFPELSIRWGVWSWVVDRN